ncbi:hypothetical protein MTX78_12215 [Hymenobacter tibetensis]|uniref:Uncharacterized protein n=1 Tax=Hymenobacter tibetensis TaxID=497967 RepID=A0ABY4CYY0_9BACT|nr:hypothetical protein [Hymenobacter tibetensis]UOG72893.1 hypothetical protein MTX78_12215 [Hymenobacter tibetensis]
MILSDTSLPTAAPVTASSAKAKSPVPVPDAAGAAAESRDTEPVSAPSSQAPITSSPATLQEPATPAAPEATVPASVSVVPTPEVALPAASTPPPAPVAASVPAEAAWQPALYTQQMAHQLAMAELRNQHLQEQQRLMQQMLDLMQRQLSPR